MQFSETEVKELVISAVVIGFSFAWIMRGSFGNFLAVFVVMLLSVGAAFICHELAHKFTAQHYGCWAEYRMWETGLILAFFLAVSVGIVFAAPGAVYITTDFYGISKEKNGIISASGPVTNLILALLFFPLTRYTGLLGMLGHFGFLINTWLALFNMIPFPPLDGSKVRAWDSRVWIAITLTSFILLRIA
ncbi:MAG: site-2 protease family protein [Candidatus Hydrothermarchaeales archaeon]